MKTKQPPTWDELCLAVEKIIDGKTVEKRTMRGRSEVIHRRRYMFTDFSEEIGCDYGELYRAVRGPQEPSTGLESAVREWVEKNK